MAKCRHGPHSLALAEAFLAPLRAAGLPDRETALAFSLIDDTLVSRYRDWHSPSLAKGDLLTELI